MKKVTIADYIPACEAAKILSDKHGRTIDSHRISKMVKMKKYSIRTIRKHDRLMYHKGDIEACVIGGPAVVV